MNIKIVEKQVIKKSGQVVESNVLRVTYENDIISYVPRDESNTEYQKICEWISQGNEIGEYRIGFDTPILTPQEKLQQAGLTVDELKGLLGL